MKKRNVGLSLMELYVFEESIGIATHKNMELWDYLDSKWNMWYDEVPEKKNKRKTKKAKQ